MAAGRCQTLAQPACAGNSPQTTRTNTCSRVAGKSSKVVQNCNEQRQQCQTAAAVSTTVQGWPAVMARTVKYCMKLLPIEWNTVVPGVTCSKVAGSCAPDSWNLLSMVKFGTPEIACALGYASPQNPAGRDQGAHRQNPPPTTVKTIAELKTHHLRSQKIIYLHVRHGELPLDLRRA